MRRSAAIAICWPIWCGGCWRTAPIPPSWRSPPTTMCRSQRCCGVRPKSSAPPITRGIRTSRCHAISSAATAKFARHRIRRTRGAGRTAFRGRRGHRASRGSASDRRRRKRRRPQLVSPIDQATLAGSVIDATAEHANAAITAARGIYSLEPDAGRYARSDRWRRPQICWSTGARISSRCCNARAARRWMTRFRKSARPPISAATTPARDANCSAPASNAGPDRREQPAELRGRGVFIAISPWNFPLAIFMGQSRPR